ncbi:hypothetical protein D3C80_1206600 [compost metagenome]
MLGNQRIVDRAGRQPVDQLLLAMVQVQWPGPLQQALAGVQVPAQTLAQPIVGGDVQHQAVAAGSTAAGVVAAGRDHHQCLAVKPRAAAFDLEFQAPAQAEHQLRVFVAMGDQVVTIMAQGKYRAAAHRKVLRQSPQCTG